MKKIVAILCFMFMTISGTALAYEWGEDINAPDNDDVEFLSGDTRLACEAILCLSSPHRPSECGSALNRYFGIKKKKWSKTLRARKKFLNLCPSASADNNMVSLTSSISYAAGNCDANALNSRGKWITKTEKSQSKGQDERSSRHSITFKAVYSEPDDYGRVSLLYYLKTTRYFQVDTSTPKVCLDYWNHQYTDFSQRPHIVHGSKPWDTEWKD